MEEEAEESEPRLQRGISFSPNHQEAMFNEHVNQGEDHVNPFAELEESKQDEDDKP